MTPGMTDHRTSTRATRAHDGKRTLFYASCGACSWIGPARSQAIRARADGQAHEDVHADD